MESLSFLSACLLSFSLFSNSYGSDERSNRTTDSLKAVLHNAKHDTSKIFTLLHLCWEYRGNGDYVKAHDLAEEALKITESFENSNDARVSLIARKGKARAYSNLGVIFDDQGDYEHALVYYIKGMVIYKQIDEKLGLAASYNNIGVTYENQSDYATALLNYRNALSLYQELEDKKGIASTYGNIGNIYANYGDYPHALENYLKGLKLDEETGNEASMANSYNNIGVVYANQKEYFSALEYYQKALKLYSNISDKGGMASAYNNIGNVYQHYSDSTLAGQKLSPSDRYKIALDYQHKGLRLREEINDRIGMATSYNNIGELCVLLCEQMTNQPGNQSRVFLDSALNLQRRALTIQQELSDKYGMTYSLYGIGRVLEKESDYPEALKYYLKAAAYSDSVGAKAQLLKICEGLYNCYKKLGSYKESLHWHEEAERLKETIFSEERQKELGRLEASHEYDKQQALSKAVYDKQIALAEEENKRQRLYIWFVVFGLFSAVVVAAIIYRALRVTRSQKVKIEEQKLVVEEQNKIIEEKNNDITDSIYSAKLIQEAILAPEHFLGKYLKDVFILFKPRDIVSGDFYWGYNTPDGFLFAVSDCTGHGVPGSFMSLLGINLLNEIVIESKITKPSAVLDELRVRVVKMLISEEEAGSKAGMDIVLFQINTVEKKLNCSGAYNSLYIARNGSLEELKTDRMPVGYHPNMVPFTMQSIDIREGDIIYAATDGYEDQFGGGQKKKFMSRRFREILLRISDKSFPEQKRLLDEEIVNWMADGEQTDDICVVGVRI